MKVKASKFALKLSAPLDMNYQRVVVCIQNHFQLTLIIAQMHSYLHITGFSKTALSRSLSVIRMMMMKIIITRQRRKNITLMRSFVHLLMMSVIYCYR